MRIEYNQRAQQIAEELTSAAGELLEHISKGSDFTRTASAMRLVGELLMRLDGQLRVKVSEVGIAEHA